MEALVILALFFGAIAAVIYALVQVTRRGQLGAALRRVNDFSPTYQTTGVDAKAMLALDQHRNAIVLLDNKRRSSLRFSHQDILSAEIVEDGVSISRTNRLSQAGTALVGAALFGGVGAVVGALTGSTTTSGKVKNMELRVVVNDTRNPVFSLRLLRLECNHGHPWHKAARERGRLWQSRLEVLIRQADRENQGVIVASGKTSIADEISRLADLKGSGALTDEEFRMAKQKLLNQIGATPVPNS